MADHVPTYVEAGDALWAAEKAVGKTQSDHDADAGKAFSDNFMHGMHILAVEVAMADGELSQAECVAINNIFWLAKACPDPWAERDTIAADPDLPNQVLDYALSCAKVLCRWGTPDQRDPDQNLLCVAVETMCQAVLAADTNPQPEVGRMTKITTALRQAVIDEAASISSELEAPAEPTTASAPDEAATPEETVASILAELDRLVGLASVKHEVGTLVNLAKVFALRRKMGVPVPDMSLHLVFLGNPGTGKTTVARIVARLYGKLGLLSKGQLVEVDRSGLVASYVGQTATKVEGVIESALGGVLFIDEAYALATGDQNDFGQEAVATLLKGMEDHRRDLVVIAAGYTGQMHRFLDMNPGLRSRLSRDIVFDDYSPTEMAAIFRGMANDAKFEMSAECDGLLLPLFQRLWDKPGTDFANARDVRNLFEQVVEAQANRVGTMAAPTQADVCAISAGDVRAAASASSTI